MLFQITHVLVYIHCFCSVCFYLIHEGFDHSGEIRVLLFDKNLIPSELFLDMRKELFEMLLIIHDKLVDDGFVQFKTWELIGVAFDDDWC